MATKFFDAPEVEEKQTIAAEEERVRKLREGDDEGEDCPPAA